MATVGTWYTQTTLTGDRGWRGISAFPDSSVDCGETTEWQLRGLNSCLLGRAFSKIDHVHKTVREQREHASSIQNGWSFCSSKCLQSVLCFFFFFCYGQWQIKWLQMVKCLMASTKQLDNFPIVKSWSQENIRQYNENLILDFFFLIKSRPTPGYKSSSGSLLEPPRQNFTGIVCLCNMLQWKHTTCWLTSKLDLGTPKHPWTKHELNISLCYTHSL